MKLTFLKFFTILLALLFGIYFLQSLNNPKLTQAATSSLNIGPTGGEANVKYFAAPIFNGPPLITAAASKTLSSSGTTVTGTNTTFTTILGVGDTITAIVSGQTRVVTAIASDTSLTTNTAFNPALSTATFSYQKPLLKLQNNSSASKLIVDVNGNLGIGTTSPIGTFSVENNFNYGPYTMAAATVNTSRRLDMGKMGLYGDGNLKYNAYYNGSSDLYVDSGTAFQLRYDTASLHFSTAPSGTAGNTVTFTDKLSLNSTGNVGIGTTGPTALLNVYSSTADKARIYLTETGDTSDTTTFSGIGFNDNATFKGGIFKSGATHNIDFWDASAKRISLQQGGNVGIGTSTPGQKLQVAGVIESTTGGIKFPDGSTQTAASAMALISDQTLGADAASIIFSSIPATYKELRLYLNSRGSSNNQGEVTVRLRFNGDAGNTYTWVRSGYQVSGGSAGAWGNLYSGSTTSYQAGTINDKAESGADTAMFGSCTVDLINYASTTLYKSISSTSFFVRDLTQTAGGGESRGIWQSATAINSITIYLNTGNLVAGSRATLYGIN